MRDSGKRKKMRDGDSTARFDIVILISILMPGFLDLNQRGDAHASRILAIWDSADIEET